VSVKPAWRYVTFNKVRTATLIACVTLIAVLPLTLEVLLAESEQQLLSRADSTPLLLGAKGSALDLVMNTLYFDDEVPELVTMAAADEIADSGLATPIPQYVRFKAQQFPIVGTTLGGSRLTIARLLIAEIAIILAASTALCGVLLLAVNHYSGDLVRALFIR
jgi:putative ABC transport system permease protein